MLRQMAWQDPFILALDPEQESYEVITAYLKEPTKDTCQKYAIPYSKKHREILTAILEIWGNDHTPVCPGINLTRKNWQHAFIDAYPSPSNVKAFIQKYHGVFLLSPRRYYFENGNPSGYGWADLIEPLQKLDTTVLSLWLDFLVINRTSCLPLTGLELVLRRLGKFMSYQTYLELPVGYRKLVPSHQSRQIEESHYARQDRIYEIRNLFNEANRVKNRLERWQRRAGAFLEAALTMDDFDIKHENILDAYPLVE